MSDNEAPIQFFTFQLTEIENGKQNPVPIAYGQVKSCDFKDAEAAILRDLWYPEYRNAKDKLPGLWIKPHYVDHDLKHLQPGDRYLRIRPGQDAEVVRLVLLSGDRAHCEADGNYITIPGKELNPLPCLGRFRPSQEQMKQMCDDCRTALISSTEEDLGQFTEW